jgi:hypothetical protein
VSGRDADTDANRDANTDTYAYGYTKCHADSDSYCYTECNPDSYSHPEYIADTYNSADRHAYTNVRAEQSSVRGNAERGARGAAYREHSHRFGHSRLKPGADNGHGKSEFCRFGRERDHGPHSCSGCPGSECADHNSSYWFSGRYFRELFE